MPTADTPVPRQLSEEERALWEKALKATTGSWVPMVVVRGGLVAFPDAEDHFIVGSEPVDGGGSVLAICGPTKGDDAEKSLADADFIAAANPAVILSLLTALSSEREAGERARKDTERIDRLHHVMHHLRGYDWNAGSPELTRAALDLAWQQLPKITRAAIANLATEPAHD